MNQVKMVIGVIEDSLLLNETLQKELLIDDYNIKRYQIQDLANEDYGEVRLWVIDQVSSDTALTCVKLLRKHQPDIPVIILSKEDDPDMKLKALEQGVDDYMIYPLSYEELRYRIRNILHRVYKNDQIIEISGYKIDPSRRSIQKGEEEILLTTKEYDLLMLFVLHIGEAFKREEILSHVWGSNYFGSDRVVDDTMRRIRKKLPDLSFMTVYGYGYRLDE